MSKKPRRDTGPMPEIEPAPAPPGEATVTAHENVDEGDSVSVDGKVIAHVRRDASGAPVIEDTRPAFASIQHIHRAQFVFAWKEPGDADGDPMRRHAFDTITATKAHVTCYREGQDAPTLHLHTKALKAWAVASNTGEEGE